MSAEIPEDLRAYYEDAKRRAAPRGHSDETDLVERIAALTASLAEAEARNKLSHDCGYQAGVLVAEHNAEQTIVLLRAALMEMCSFEPSPGSDELFVETRKHALAVLAARIR